MRRRSFLLGTLPVPAQAGALRVAPFQADITPSVGMSIYTGTARSIVDPLEARGIVLEGDGKPVVIAGLDWCEIRNLSYDRWRDGLAAAANTTRDRVLLSCVHQHDAPYTDIEAQQLLMEVRSSDNLCDIAFEQSCID